MYIKIILRVYLFILLLCPKMTRILPSSRETDQKQGIYFPSLIFFPALENFFRGYLQDFSHILLKLEKTIILFPMFLSFYPCSQTFSVYFLCPSQFSLHFHIFPMCLSSFFISPPAIFWRTLEKYIFLSRNVQDFHWAVLRRWTRPAHRPPVLS